MSSQNISETVTVKLTVDSGGGYKIEYLSGGSSWQPQEIPNGASGTYKFTQSIVLADSSTSAGFYAISFGGEPFPRGQGGGTQREEAIKELTTDVSQLFLDGWYNGNASFAIGGGTRSQFVDDISVNTTTDSNGDKISDPGKISFEITNYNTTGTDGAVSLRVTFKYTDSNGYDYFLTSRDPEITLERKPTQTR